MAARSSTGRAERADKIRPATSRSVRTGIDLDGWGPKCFQATDERRHGRQDRASRHQPDWLPPGRRSHAFKLRRQIPFVPVSTRRRSALAALARSISCRALTTRARSPSRRRSRAAMLCALIRTERRRSGRSCPGGTWTRGEGRWRQRRPGCPPTGRRRVCGDPWGHRTRGQRNEQGRDR